MTLQTPKCSSMAIALAMLFASFSSAYPAGNNILSPSLKERVAAKQTKLLALTEQLESQRQVAKEKQAIKTAAENKKSQLTMAQQETDRLKTEIASVRAKQKELDERFQTYRRHYQQQERTKAVGESLGRLQTKNGKVYHQVEIREITAAGISFWHKDEDGNKDLGKESFEKLPDELRHRFGYDPAEAEKFLNQEEQNRHRHIINNLKMAEKNAAAREQEQKQQQLRKQAQDRQPDPVPAVKKRKGKISVKPIAHGKGHTQLKITATAGTESMTVKVFNDANRGRKEPVREFVVPGNLFRQEHEYICRVKKKYVVEAYQGGKLVGKQTTMNKNWRPKL